MQKCSAGLVLVCAASIALPCFSQNPATFNVKTTASTIPYVRTGRSVDVNNDGRPDLILEDSSGTSGFNIFTSNGDGTFTQGYSYFFSSKYQSGNPMAYGDFNGDGKLDLLAELAGTNQVAFFAGNGDGTFQSPVYENIGLPSGQIFSGEDMLVADFTGDGKVDVITGSAPNLVLLPGLGTGNFGTAKVIYTAPPDHGAGWSLRLGDFDADGKADYAFSESTVCNQGGCTAGTVHVEYGDGTGNFTDTTPYSSSGYVFQFNTGDLNNDGKTDIVGFNDGGGTPQMIALYGQSGRTFALHTMSSGWPSTASGLGVPVIGDFNGDGAADVAALGMYSGQSAIGIFLGDNTPGTFTVETLKPSINAQSTQADFLAGDFNRDTKPDLVWTNQSNNAAGGPVTIVSELNATSGAFTSGCSYPAKGQGINNCAVTSSTSTTATFHATANSFGKIRKLELWVDGKKIGEQRHDWADHNAFFNLTTTLAAGSHKGTYYAADIDNRLQRLDFGFSVGTGTCSAPSTPSVHVCSPVNYSTVTSPTTVSATATITGTLARMEVWVDGVKKYTETTSKSLNISVALSSGKQHKIDVYAANTAGNLWETTAWATVN